MLLPKGSKRKYCCWLLQKSKAVLPCLSCSTSSVKEHGLNTGMDLLLWCKYCKQNTPRRWYIWALTSPAVRSGTNTGSCKCQLITHGKSKGQLHVNVNISFLSPLQRRYIAKLTIKKFVSSWSSSVFKGGVMQATHSYNTYKSVCAVSRKHALKSPSGDANRRNLTCIRGWHFHH